MVRAIARGAHCEKTLGGSSRAPRGIGPAMVVGSDDGAVHQQRQLVGDLVDVGHRRRCGGPAKIVAKQPLVFSGRDVNGIFGSRVLDACIDEQAAMKLVDAGTVITLLSEQTHRGGDGGIASTRFSRG